MLSRTVFSFFAHLVIGSFLLAALPAMAVPSDVTLLKSLDEAALEGRSVADVKATLQSVALKRTDSIAQSRRYPAPLRSSNPLVRQYILGEIANSLPNASFASKADKKRALDIALEILSGDLSEKAIAYAAFQAAPKPPGQWGRRPLSASATVNSQSPLAMDLSASSVTQDRGTIGSGNGILDPGETAVLNLRFKNTSNRRLMSTSLYPRGLSECLFPTSPFIGKEYELKELDPGASQTLSFGIYASSECAGRTGTIYIDGYDTHEFSAAPLKYALKLSLSDATQATLVNVRIDRDDYGHSEPTKSSRIQPEDKVEVSASLALRKPGYSFAKQTILSPPGAASASHKPGRVAFRAVNGRYVARMHDDLDLVFPNKTQLLAKLRPLAEAYGWKDINDARVFVAIDTQFGTKSSATSTSPRSKPTYTFDSSALKKHLAKHLHVEVNRTSTPPSEGRIAVGSVDGFRFEIDDPGPLMVKLQEIELEVKEPKKQDPSSYLVRHYIELPIFWERALNPTCSLNAPNSARTGERFPVGISFSEVPVGSRLLVSGMGVRHTSTTETESGALSVGNATMPARSSEISLQIIDQDGATICFENRRITNNTPVAKATPKPKPVYTPKPDEPLLPVATLALNGHLGGMGGFDVTATLGRSFGVAVSAGSIGDLSARTIGPRATQMISSDPDGIQISLTESLEFGRRTGVVNTSTEDLDGMLLSTEVETIAVPYSRASIYLSAYRVIGVNVGLHFETNRFGELSPSFRLGIGGFFDADY